VRQPLHVTSYSLNLELQYFPDFKVDTKVKIDLLPCIQKMVADLDEQHLIDLQLEDFKNQEIF